VIESEEITVGPGRYRVGIDIGGTFTDGTLIDEESGVFRIAKVLSTPTDPSIGFMTVLDGEGSSTAAPETLALVDAEVRRIADTAHRDIVALLRNERARLDALAEALLDQETLDADEVYKAVGLVKPPRREEHPPLAVVESAILDSDTI